MVSCGSIDIIPYVTVRYNIYGGREWHSVLVGQLLLLPVCSCRMGEDSGSDREQDGQKWLKPSHKKALGKGRGGGGGGGGGGGDGGKEVDGVRGVPLLRVSGPASVSGGERGRGASTGGYDYSKDSLEGQSPLPPSLHHPSLPPSLSSPSTTPLSLPPSIPPSLSPYLPPFLPLCLLLSLPLCLLLSLPLCLLPYPSFSPSLYASFSPSLYASLPPSLPPSMSPSLPPSSTPPSLPLCSTVSADNVVSSHAQSTVTNSR